ncbi:MAG: hypothetical protein KDD64_12705, partial [Bdellovibrionales bacterium]|nr:hypothetical protein [Bdellovibrionales bacterium]
MGQKELKLALVDLAGEEIHLATTALPGNSQLVECSRFEELPSDVELIICVVGSTEDMCLQGSKKIISESSLHDKPLVIVGHQVAELERVFGRYFEFFETVSQPFEQNEIRFAIERLRARYLRRKKLTTITDQSTPFSAESSQDDLRVGLTLELALEIDEFSSESQAALNKLEKATQWIGGEHYHDEIEAEKLVSLPLFPQSPLLQKSLCEVAAEAPEAARQRLLRGCFLLASASDLLHLPEERKEAILSTRVKIAA